MERAMFKHILIATDGSDRSERAIRMGIGVAKLAGAKVTAVMATWPVPPVFMEDWGQMIPNEQLEQYTTDFARRCLSVAADAAIAAGVQCELAHVVEREPYEAILQTATTRGSDLIVMASHGRSGAEAMLLGSETSKVLAHANVPVLVCR